MTQKDKEAVIAALEEYKGDSTGLIAMTVEDCQRVVRGGYWRRVSGKMRCGTPGYEI